jgi:FixJ family two-component response regulator
MTVEASGKSEDRAVVHIVDDDDSLRRALERVFRSVGLETQTYSTASEFIDAAHPDLPGCLVLDVRLPGINAWSGQPASATLSPISRSSVA